MLGYKMKVTYTDKSGKKIEQVFGTEDEGERQKKLKDLSKVKALLTQNGNGKSKSTCQDAAKLSIHFFLYVF